MKDKFEKAITKCRWEDSESGKSGIDEEWAAKECNTLHQQALKEGKRDILIRMKSFIHAQSEIRGATESLLNFGINKIAEENNIEL